MIKLSTMLAAFMLISATSPAQSVKEKIEEQAKDPKTVENAAKADVFVTKNKSLFDSSTVISSANDGKAAKERKKKKCRKKQ